MSDEDIPPPGQGVTSSKSSLSEAESLLIDMMKRQATVKAPSGGADILAAGRHLGKDDDGREDGGKKKHAFWETQPMKVNESDQSGSASSSNAPMIWRRCSPNSCFVFLGQVRGNHRW